MPPKKIRSSRARRGGNVGKKILNAVKKVGNVIKKEKLVSKALANATVAKKLGSMGVNVGEAQKLAAKSGVGKRRRAKRGGNVLKTIGRALKSAHNYVKKNKLISRFAGKVGAIVGQPQIGEKIGEVAGTLGYGVRRMRPAGYAKSSVRPRAIRRGGAMLRSDVRF